MHSDTPRFTQETETALRALGWFPGRDLRKEISDWTLALGGAGLPIFAAAEKALREFGGLRSTVTSAGLQCAREPFEIEPLLARGDEDLFVERSRALGMALFPLGEVADGHEYLAISEDGRVFTFFEGLSFVGATMDQAIEALILGKLNAQ